MPARAHARPDRRATAPVLLALLTLGLLLATLVAPLTAAPAASADPGEIGTRSLQSDRARERRTATGPQQVRTTDFGKVSSGGEFSCGIRGAGGGTLWCWGRNTYGQLGNGSYGPGPVPPTQVGTGDAWSQVSAGGSTTCAVRTDHALFCWGLNHRGQLGNGTTTKAAKPQLVTKQKVWKQVSVGWFHVCAVKVNGRIFCWGDNTRGELGTGNTTSYRTPHRLAGKGWGAVSVGGWSTCATRTDHSLWCWGRNVFGQLGTGDLLERHSPGQVGTSKTWAEVSLSWSHTCGRQRSGAVRCWGRNDRGQVGEGGETYVRTPMLVPGEHKARSIATGEGSSCLVDTEGALWCWGDNRFGQVDTSAPSDVPVYVPTRRAGDLTKVSGGWFHYCGVTTAKATVCWGDNLRGQLGDGRSVPPGTQRVKPTTERTDGPLSFRLATLNTLSNSHTRPGADSDQYGPSRMRADWTAQALVNNEIDVVGLQEQDAGQLGTILDGAMGKLASYPAPSAGDLKVETTLVWNAEEFVAVETGVVRSQFIARTLPRPYVKLRQVTTGREFWVMDIHNAPNGYQSKRNKATNQQIAKIKELEATGLPVFYVGDFNEKQQVFCKVRRQTGLVSPTGGKIAANGDCVTPRYMRIDWLFGSKSARWTGYAVAQPPLVRLSTDHHMVMADVMVP